MHHYSPHPVEAYFLPIREHEIPMLCAWEHGVPAWNLYWLSHPPLDRYPNCSVRDIPRVYISSPALLSSLVQDVGTNATLRNALMQPPARFKYWLENYHQTYKLQCFVTGGYAWLNLVLQRAQEAGDRRLKAKPLIRFDKGLMVLDCSIT